MYSARSVRNTNLLLIQMYQLSNDHVINKQRATFAAKAQSDSAINNDQMTPVSPNKAFIINNTGMIIAPCKMAIIVAPRPCQSLRTYQ